MKSNIRLLPGSLQMINIHRQSGQQPDNLCGPYWLSILLNAFVGVSLHPANIGIYAGSILPETGDALTWIPRGASNRQDYGISLPLGALASSGTSVYGLIEATLQLSNGQYTLIPLQARWSAEKVQVLMQLCEAHPQWEAVPLCNIRTRHLWGTRLEWGKAMAYLNGLLVDPPTSDWNVGHFVTLAGIVAGACRSLMIVRDTYPMMGWDGYHLQPLEAIATALNRDDGNQGGVLLFVATNHQAAVEAHSRALGFAIAPWDNGTPWFKGRPNDSAV